MLPHVYALDSSVFILPAPPTNAAALNTTLTEVELTWDASPNSPASVASYTVFYKKTTDASYPLTPQVTRTDSLATYTQSITVESGIVYDILVRTNATNGSTSQEDCDSCKTNNVLLCGNGVIDIFVGETCDGILLGDAVCTDFGFVGGTLGCSPITCLYSFTACSSSGGGNPVNVDSVAPNPGIAVSPAYTNTSPIVVTYSGASDTGGSGLAYVTLFAKKGTGSWINTGLTSPGTSGSFNFIPQTDPNAVYYFDLQASDNQGNQSSNPTGSGDTSTIYDTQKPTIGTITKPVSSTTAPITIAYENAVDVGISGLNNIELWFKRGTTGDWTNSTLLSSASTGSFSFTPTDGSANYYFDLIAVDKAGNKSIEVTETVTPTMYDKDPPALAAISMDEPTIQSPIIINYTGAIDVGPAGLKQLELWYKKEAGGAWTKTALTSTTVNGTFNYIPSQSSGTYYFAIILEDNLGNRTANPTGDGVAVVIYTATPIVAVLSDLPASETPTGTASITVGGTGITAYKYKLNTNAYSTETPVATKITLNNLTEGAYTLSVIGKNSANQWQDILSPTTYSWTVKFPPPVIPVVATLSTLPSATTEQTTASITVGGTDVVAYQYKLDSGIYTQETLVATKINLSNLTAGVHTISVIGKNTAGTWQSTASPTTYSWTVSSPTPVASVIAVLSTLPPATTEQKTASITVGGTDVVVYQYILDTGVYSEELPVTTKINLSNLTAGVHTINVIGKNTAGTWQNTTSPTTYSWTVTQADTAEPVKDTFHCENQILDVDELGTDCGGNDCVVCIDVLVSILTRPMGRMPGFYGSEGVVNLYSPVNGRLIKSTDVLLPNSGIGNALITRIPAGTYNIGMKSHNYLQKIIDTITLVQTDNITTLDFTLSGIFLMFGGDVFNDNIINSFDLALMLKNYLIKNISIDMNLDGIVNASDLAMVLKNYRLIGDTP